MQVAEVMSLYREIFAIDRSTHKLMTRHLAARHVRIVAAGGLESLRRIMQASWSYAVAADASAQIHGTAYFAIRIHLSSIDRKTTSLVNLHLVAPPNSGAPSGKSMYNLTASVLTAFGQQLAQEAAGCNLRWNQQYDRLLFGMEKPSSEQLRGQRASLSDSLQLSSCQPCEWTRNRCPARDWLWMAGYPL
jgi:hypothetical protein